MKRYVEAIIFFALFFASASCQEKSLMFVHVYDLNIHGLRENSQFLAIEEAKKMAIERMGTIIQSSFKKYTKENITDGESHLEETTESTYGSFSKELVVTEVKEIYLDEKTNSYIVTIKATYTKKGKLSSIWYENVTNNEKYMLVMVGTPNDMKRYCKKRADEALKNYQKRWNSSPDVEKEVNELTYYLDTMIVFAETPLFFKLRNPRTLEFYSDAKTNYAFLQQLKRSESDSTSFYRTIYIVDMVEFKKYYRQIVL